MNADRLMEKVRARFEWALYRDVLDEVFRALKKADRLEKRLEAVEARTLAKGVSYQSDLGALEDRMARLERAVRGLVRRVKALEEALEAHQAQAEEDRALQIARARAEVDELAPRVFAARGGDADVLVMADYLRARLAQGDLESVLPVLEAWRREVGAR